MQAPSGFYNPRPWGQPPEDDKTPRYNYIGPFASREEQLTQQSLSVMTIPGQELSEMVRPPIPQIMLFAPKFGYRREAAGITDIVNVSRFYQNPRVTWYSGTDAGYEGSTRNALGGI